MLRRGFGHFVQKSFYRLSVSIVVQVFYKDMVFVGIGTSETLALAGEQKLYDH